MFSILSSAQNVAEKAVPVFKDGKAQIVDAFNGDHNWVNHDLWTETEFDTDRDGEPNRMHVSVTRPKQTDTTGKTARYIYQVLILQVLQKMSQDPFGTLKENLVAKPKNAHILKSHTVQFQN